MCFSFPPDNEESIILDPEDPYGDDDGASSAVSRDDADDQDFWLPLDTAMLQSDRSWGNDWKQCCADMDSLPKLLEETAEVLKGLGSEAVPLVIARGALRAGDMWQEVTGVVWLAAQRLGSIPWLISTVTFYFLK